MFNFVDIGMVLFFIFNFIMKFCMGFLVKVLENI